MWLSAGPGGLSVNSWLWMPGHDLQCIWARSEVSAGPARPPVHPGLMFPCSLAGQMGRSTLSLPPSCSWADAVASMGGVRLLGPGKRVGVLLTLLAARQPWAECAQSSQSLSSSTSPDPELSEALGPLVLASKMEVSQKTPGCGGGGPLVVDQASHLGA